MKKQSTSPKLQLKKIKVASLSGWTTAVKAGICSSPVLSVCVCDTAGNPCRTDGCATDNVTCSICVL